MELGSVADWVSGIGSFSAVVTALYLSRAAQRVRLTGYCGHRAFVGQGIEPVDVFAVSVTNVGARATVISGIWIKVGIFRKRHAMLVVNADEYSVGIPKAISDGETAHWAIPLQRDHSWVASVCDDFVKSKLDVATFRVSVHTTNGGFFTFNPGGPFRKMMKEALKKNSSAVKGEAV